MQTVGPAWPILIKRGITRGLVMIWRERGWMTSFGALFGVLLLVQLLLLVLLGMEGAQLLLRTRSDLRLEIRETAQDQNIQEFLSALQQLPYVDDVVYITREQAYERSRERDPELIAFLEEFGLQNPFPETIGITLGSLDDYEEFSQFVERPAWQSVVDPTFLTEVTEQETHIYELLRLTQAGRSLVVLFLLITAVTLVFITTELVRRRALVRADEVLVERLVGAHAISILLPFATEATFLFWGAIVISGDVLLLFLFYLPTLVPALATGGALEALHAEVVPLLWQYLPIFFLTQALVAPVLAGIGTWMGIRPQLRATTLALPS